MDNKKAIKKSVRLKSNAILNCRIMSDFVNDDESEINWSGSLNAICERYTMIMEDNKPDLSEREWNAFYSVYNGHLFHQDINVAIQQIPWDLTQAFKYDSNVADWIGDEEALFRLVDRIENWSVSTRLSLIYHTQKFWVRDK